MKNNENKSNNNKSNNNKSNRNKIGNVVYYFFNENEEHLNIQSLNKINYKMTPNTFFVSNELTNSQIIATIPNYKNHYYVCESSNDLILTKLNDDSRYLLSAKELYTGQNTVLLKWADRGTLISLKNYLKALSSSRKYIFHLTDFYKCFLRGIELLVDNRIVHNNFKMSSLYVDSMDCPLIADFTFSINVNQCKNIDYIKRFFVDYDPSYLEWPLEFHLLAFLLTNNLNSLSFQNIEAVVTDFIKHNHILKTFGEQLVSSSKEEALQYFRKYINQSVSFIVTDIFQHFGSWDNYALSIMYLKYFISMHRAIKKRNKFIIYFMKLLVSNISLNPLKRLSIEMTKKELDSLMDNIEASDLKQLLEHLMAT